MNNNLDTRYITAIVFSLALVIAVFMFNSKVLNRISEQTPKTAENVEGELLNSPIAPPSAGVVPDGDLSDNYLSNAVNASGSYAVWQNMPVQVYISENSYKRVVESAFTTYNNSFNGLISFSFVDNPNNAQIKVTFPARIENAESDQFIAGLTNNFSSGKYIQSSTIQLLTEKNGVNLSSTSVYNTALHEIGHALGINGHSQNRDDVMFAQTQSSRTAALTARDLATLKIMYSNNEDLISQNTAGAGSEKLREAIRYTQQVPDKTAGWINLGNVYYDLKMLPEALEAYKKALKIDPSDANIYASMGTCYYSSKKYETAAEFFGYAMERTAEPVEIENYEYMRALSTLSAKKYEDAYVQYSSLVNKYPNKKEYLINYLYLCTYLNKPEGKDKLQAFLQANPEADSDNNIQQYKRFYKL
ncbi:tetratricopeptide repeat protein [bacterium]|nr:tetratricopeptide repeat protein [bacterium]